MSRWSWQILDWQRQWSIPLHQCCNPRFVEQLHGGHQKLLGKIILHKRLMFIALESCAHKFYLEILHPFGNPPVRVLERISSPQHERPSLPSNNSDLAQLLSLIKECWAPNPHERPKFSIICRRLKEIRLDLLVCNELWKKINLMHKQFFIL